MMCLALGRKGKWCFLRDFNARVGKAVDSDDVIGTFGEDTCKSSGNRLISFLDLVVCNGRRLVLPPHSELRVY